ncbi:hypothetical protein ATKI12_5382 [Kitasatospora sp. Ki12]|uniref:hypothetical protein n=1 Tax=Kitasatospora xanthocidica TaxID=83382 RepID=UPI0016746F33|nr:hypothetical protein [Kitasatospora xanthocidica]GHF55029.1 hypothetical protein GCM10018790_36260 [Kitasatospora xanthocidica]
MTATSPTGPAPPPDRTAYRVTYAVSGEVRQDEVTVVPGYSREDDIPRILAARLTALPSGFRPEVVVLDLREI